MPTPRKKVSDDILEGYLVAKAIPCDHCKKAVWSIEIHKVILPPGIKPSNSLILFREGAHGLEGIGYIGVMCGCYARLHRQMAHIQAKMKKS
jgi:hypothetical protein